MHPSFTGERAVIGIVGQHSVPGTINVVDAVLVPHWALIAIARCGVFIGFIVDLEVFEWSSGGGVALGHHGLFSVPVGQSIGLNHSVRNIDTEPINTAIEPEAQNVLKIGAHLGVFPVEVRLTGIEKVEIPLPGGTVSLGDAGPCPATEYRLPVIGRLASIRALTIAEQDRKSVV